MTDKKLRVGLIGIGSFAPFFVPYIREVTDVVAICSRSASNRSGFLEKMGLKVPGFGDCRQMMDKVPMDAVFIMSANCDHHNQTIAAAERGIHVFCEKPMANSVAECWEMIRACEKAGVRLMVGHKRRLRPPWARMIELCDVLGPVVAMNVCAYHDARPYNFQGWWTRREDCGGVLALIGVHKIDWMRGIAGDVARVRAVAAPQIDPRYDYSDTLHLSLDFRSGAIGSLCVSLSYPPMKFRESSGPLIVCRDGGMRMIPFMDHIDLYWQHCDDKEPRHERFDDLGFDQAYRLEIGDFVRWITEGKPPCLTWREGLRCIEVMEAARRSADQQGSIISLPLYPELEKADNS
jgi:predicted dehydrogenase